MKVLKTMAVLSMVLTLGACKTAPGETGGATLDKALNEAIDGVGNTAGLTRYNYEDEDADSGGSYTMSYSFFINTADPKEIKEARAAFQVSGTMEGSDGNDYPVNNQLQAQLSFIYGSLAVENTPAGITAAGYKFYKSTCTQSKGKQYDPAKKDFMVLADGAGNISVGDVYYFAIKDEGSQITVKTFSRTMPTTQDAFDRENATIYKK